MTLLFCGYLIVTGVTKGANEMVVSEATHQARLHCLGDEVDPIKSNWYRLNPDLFMETFGNVNCEQYRKWYKDKLSGASGEPTLQANHL